MTLKRYDNLRVLVRNHFSLSSQALVDKALEFAAERLSGLSRYDGSPMLDHSVGVAIIGINEIGLGRRSTLSTILHDTIRIANKEGESEEALLELSQQIKELFGEEVLGIAMGLASISEIKLKTDNEQAANFRELIISYSTDPRVILIKMADRLEVMRQLEIFPHEKQLTKSWESLNLYAQIAHKLGLYQIKSELEDLALKYLDPESYQTITQKLRDGEAQRLAFINKFIEPLQQRLDTNDIKYHIKSRTKSIYSIWNKIKNKGIPFEKIYDIFAIRIVVDDCPVPDEKRVCWSVYSIVSDVYTPNPERLKDWITIPKSNGYESLHTTVAAGDGRWVEIQVRTSRMDSIAERGIAAHWKYKGVNQGAESSEVWLSRLRELMEASTEGIADRFDAKPTSSEIFVFTPNGDIRKLRKGATLLDFAFDIHSNIGATCVGGRVNSRAASISEELKSGDVVEIQTQKNQKPKASWLNITVTSKARNRIKSLLREESAKSASIGREELERKIRNWKIATTIDDAVVFLCKHYKLKTATELYELIATQKIDISLLKELLQKYVSGEIDDERRAAAAEMERLKLKNKSEQAALNAKNTDDDALIIESGISQLEYKLARCCNPIKGDRVFGFITISQGITIHREDCPNAARLRQQYPYRVMEAKWRENASGAFIANIAIIAKDTPGVMNQITDMVERELQLKVRSFNFSSRSDGTSAGSVSVEVPSTGIIDTIIHSILRVKGVIKVYRTNKN
ncbi:MAG: RelA/SpoT family protein [Rikenellaceae bacterium]